MCITPYRTLTVSAKYLPQNRKHIAIVIEPNKNVCLKKRINKLHDVIRIQKISITETNEAVNYWKKQLGPNIHMEARLLQPLASQIYEDLGSMVAPWILTPRQNNPKLGNCPQCYRAGPLGRGCCKRNNSQYNIYTILTTNTGDDETCLEMNAIVVAKFMNANIEMPEEPNFQPSP